MRVSRDDIKDTRKAFALFCTEEEAQASKATEDLARKAKKGKDAMKQFRGNPLSIQGFFDKVTHYQEGMTCR